MTRVVLIGKEGQVARAIEARLRAAAHDVITLARPDYDLLRPAGIAAAIAAADPDVVVNPAAYTAVDRAEDEPDVAFAINATAAGVIAEASARVDAPIIHVSTDYVFDGAKTTPYAEEDPTNPIGVYGQSKLAGERAVIGANSRHVIVRTAWVCSPDGHNFLKTMLRLGAERPVLRVVDDQRGSPTFAADLAGSVETILERLARPQSETAPFGIFHAAGAGETTWCGFARAIMAGATARGLGPMATVEAITTADYPTKARRPAYSKLATGKLAADYGVRLPVWTEGLERCLDTLIGPRSGVGRHTRSREGTS